MAICIVALCWRRVSNTTSCLPLITLFSVLDQALHDQLPGGGGAGGPQAEPPRSAGRRAHPRGDNAGGLRQGPGSPGEVFGGRNILGNLLLSLFEKRQTGLEGIGSAISWTTSRMLEKEAVRHLLLSGQYRTAGWEGGGYSSPTTKE